MFLALRDIRAARGRFALITLTVAMLSLLVSFLFGLTGGLRFQNVAAFSTLGGNYAYLSHENLDRSQLSLAETEALLDTETPATAMGVSRLTIDEELLAVLALRPGKAGPAHEETPLPEAGEVAVSSGAAQALGVGLGDTITVADEKLTVSSITGDDWFNHQRVLWTQLNDNTPANIVFTTDALAEPGTDIVELPTAKVPEAMTAFKAQSMSLMLINIILFIVTALVTGAFFTVWMMQRTSDIATLKALGASTTALIVDALGQATIILLTGIILGMGGTLLTARLLGDALPFALSATSLAVPAVAIFLLGLGGAAAALSFLRSTSALAALGENR